jgi:hypothetical protein
MVLKIDRFLYVHSKYAYKKTLYLVSKMMFLNFILLIFIHLADILLFQY